MTTGTSRKAVRVICGSDQDYTDLDGVTWQGTRELSDAGGWGYTGGGPYARQEWLQVHAARRPGLFRCEHVAPQSYVFRLPNGCCTIRLHFAETCDCTYRAGMRAFDVAVNGAAVLNRFDPYLAAGGFARPVVVEVRGVAVTGGQVRIDFSVPGEGGAFVNAIEVEASETEAFGMSIRPECPSIVLPAGYDDCAAPEGTVRMLFAGHSHSTYWAIPQSVEYLVNRVHGTRLTCYALMDGGFGISEVSVPMGLFDKVRNGAYDVVVLQGFYKDDDDRAGADIAAMVREQGGTLLLHQPFRGRNGAVENWLKTMEHHRELASEWGVGIVPVGEAWALVLDEHPELVLYHDGGHAGLLGGYLITCTFYSYFTGKSAVGIAQPAVLAGQAPVPREQADVMADAAFRACRKAGVKPLATLA